jgi:chemotaxis protein histidine kinase CheA
VRDHVRAIGGHISVLTSPEGGARFEIRLPMVEEAL